MSSSFRKPAVDDLADEERVVADADAVWRTSQSTYATDCASTGAPVARRRRYGNPLSVSAGEVDLDRLGELADDRPVLAVDDAQR